MRARFDDASGVDHDDAVGVDDRREAVRDHDRGPAAQRLVERPLDRELRLGVEVRGRFVEDHDRRVLQQEPRDREALLLAARHPVPALADDGVETVGQRLDEIPDAGALRAPGAGRRRSRRRRAKRRFARMVSWKRCGSCGTSPIAAWTDAEREVAHVVAVDAHRALPRRRRPGARASRSWSCPRPTRRPGRRSSPGSITSETSRRVQSLGSSAPGVPGASSDSSDTSRPGRVAEPHVVELDPALGVDEVDGAGPVGDRGGEVDDLEHPLERHERGRARRPASS